MLVTFNKKKFLLNYDHNGQLLLLNFLFLCLLFENETQITQINTQLNKQSLAKKFEFV